MGWATIDRAFTGTLLKAPEQSQVRLMTLFSGYKLFNELITGQYFLFYSIVC